MKKRIIISVSILLVALCLVGKFSIGPAKLVGEEGVITKARQEIKDLAGVETIEMNVIGRDTIEKERQLFWIMTGNQYQMHRYYPMEVIETEEGVYEFVKLYPGGKERGQDICFEQVGSGYSFLINNPNCKSMVIDGTAIPVTEIPFVYTCPFVPGNYLFLDGDGNECS